MFVDVTYDMFIFCKSSHSYHTRYDEGGCPCPSGEVKCGVSEYSSGYCTTLCCDWTIEQTCYDSNREPISCRRYEDGPCPAFADDIVVESSTNPSTSEQPSSMPSSVYQSVSDQPSSIPSSQPSISTQQSLRGKRKRTVRKEEQEHSLRLWHRKEHLGGERL